ncbi:hypothetical protein [Aliiruegeria haliotis]|uniref:hypothetical protein n=1 Tax=Aliiruegeria haliotis TaxID=1280846 RepID=UPI0011B1C67B|nr:hypothetical protein [Aliiruegeria haliotis]
MTQRQRVQAQDDIAGRPSALAGAACFHAPGMTRRAVLRSGGAAMVSAAAIGQATSAMGSCPVARLRADSGEVISKVGDVKVV